MPISIIELDTSSKEDNITILLGQNVILKIIEKPNSKTLLDNIYVKKFVSSSNLCEESLQKQLSDLFIEESKLSQVNMEIAHEHDEICFLREREKLSKSLLDKTKAEDRFRRDIDGLQIQIAYLEDCITDGLKKNKEEFSKIDEKMVSIDKNIKKELGISILTSHIYIFCSDCGTLISSEEYDSNEQCTRCKKEIKRKDAEHIYVHEVNDKIREVWESGLWFEAYMSRLLRKLNWQTWTNVFVMGSSGILHEIDFLAIKDGSVIVGECKTGKVSRNDVFNFITKAGDIKAHVSILAMINELPEPETREFIQRNPSIIRLENMCKLKEDDIIGDLKNRLSFKT